MDCYDGRGFRDLPSSPRGLDAKNCARRMPSFAVLAIAPSHPRGGSMADDRGYLEAGEDDGDTSAATVNRITQPRDDLMQEIIDDGRFPM